MIWLSVVAVRKARAVVKAAANNQAGGAGCDSLLTLWHDKRRLDNQASRNGRFYDRHRSGGVFFMPKNWRGRNKKMSTGKLFKFYQSPAWRHIAELYRKQQHYTCERCGEPGNVVHHTMLQGGI